MLCACRVQCKAYKEYIAFNGFLEDFLLFANTSGISQRTEKTNIIIFTSPKWENIKMRAIMVCAIAVRSKEMKILCIIVTATDAGNGSLLKSWFYPRIKFILMCSLIILPIRTTSIEYRRAKRPVNISLLNDTKMWYHLKSQVYHICKYRASAIILVSHIIYHIRNPKKHFQ